MADKKTSKKTEPKKDSVVIYATSDGQVFSRGTAEQRLQYARNHAFKFHPALTIKEVK